jgi:hypothetical protein
LSWDGKRRMNPQISPIDVEIPAPRALWVPAVNNHGSLGRWMFVEVDDPWNVENLILSSSRDFDGKHS